MDSVLERIQRLQQTCQQVVAEVILLSYELRHLKETEALKRELESAVIPPEKKQDRKPSPPRVAASSSRPKPKKTVTAKSLSIAAEVSCYCVICAVYGVLLVFFYSWMCSALSTLLCGEQAQFY